MRVSRANGPHYLGYLVGGLEFFAAPGSHVFGRYFPDRYTLSTSHINGPAPRETSPPGLGLCSLSLGHKNYYGIASLFWVYLRVSLHPVSPRRTMNSSGPIIQSYLDWVFHSEDPRIQSLECGSRGLYATFYDPSRLWHQALP